MTSKGKTDKSKTSKRTVEVGKVYSCKTGGSYVPVRIDKSVGKGRYQGMSMTDGKPVKVSAGDIRGDGQSCKDWHLSQQHAAKETAAQAIETADSQKAKPKADKPAQSKPKATKSERKPSGLEAAAQVLTEAGEPLDTKTMVERMLAKGLWKTGGKTPAATIYAAIIREIATKGDKSRFRKTDRGKFTLAK
jgi:hypothetical protein